MTSACRSARRRIAPALFAAASVLLIGSPAIQVMAQQAAPVQPPAPPSGGDQGGNTAAPAPPSTQPQPPEATSPTAPKPHAKTAAPTDPLDQKLELGDGHRVWHPSRRQLGFISSPTGGFTIDAAKARAYFKKIAPYVHRAPERARIVIKSKSAYNPLSTSESSVPVPAKVFPATPGASLNIPGSVAAVQHAIAADPETIHIVLAVKQTPIADASYKYAGINARIAHFVTRFNPGERGRTQTVRLAIQLVDNHVVAPGDTFSLNQTVGERTAQRGFGKGIVFVSGHLDTQLGGGMCQVATTLFNAILLANLKVVERHQHVRTVPYVKPGQDATVYWGQKDFKFQNNTATPIYISYKTTGSHAICDIFGKAEPSVKVRIVDDYRHLGPRHYTAVLRRYVSENGKTRVDYTADSSYRWTPSLDYTM